MTINPCRWNFCSSIRVLNVPLSVQLHCDRICGELDSLGVANSSVGFAYETGTLRRAFILQRFSSKWNTFIDVDKAEVSNGDRLTVPTPVAVTQKVIT